MKVDLLNDLICPRCRRGFKLRIFTKKGEEIVEGLLLSGCGEWFPVIDFIPRILSGDLRRIIYREHPEFFEKYVDRLPSEKYASELAGAAESKVKTSASFGYEWTKFSKMFPEWEKNFNWYFEPVFSSVIARPAPLGGARSGLSREAPLNGTKREAAKQSLKDKIVLEVGCGKGRHTFYAAKLAKEIFAVDLSRAIDVARKNNAENKSVHFIQADVFNLPFRPGFFDFAFSLGVLHHLPDPERGFRTILKFMKPDAGILIYVYHKLPAGSFNYFLLKIVNAFRRLTVRLPHNVLHALCYPIAALSFIFIILPYSFLRRFGLTKNFARRFPLKLYADYPFQVILNDTFDRFSAPVENRYSKEEISAWYERAGLWGVRILGGGGWRIFGVK